MAGRKPNATTTADIENTNDNVVETYEDESVIEENLNLDALVTVKSLANWHTSFQRKHDGIGTDIMIAPNGQQRMSRNEISAQILSGNTLFTGVDGRGSHATLYIDDAPTRRWTGLESKGNPQKILTSAVIKELFKLSQSEFEKQFINAVKTRAEKYATMQFIKNLGLNDYSKIVFASKYTGFSI